MNTMQRRAVLLSLVRRLGAHGSWCGETHIQKATFFLQELLGVPLDLNVILYKHGPYSFDLSAELMALRAEQMLEVVPRDPRYGPSLRDTEEGRKEALRYPQTVGQYQAAIEFVAANLADKNVKELERLSTALYVLRNFPGLSDPDLSNKITGFKPHVTRSEAEQALTDVRQMQAEAPN